MADSVTPAVPAAPEEEKSVKPPVPETGIENLLEDPEIAAAYEAHKSKEVLPTDKGVIAGQVVQLCVIFRQEKIDFVYSGKHVSVHHASSGALFLNEKAYNVADEKGRSNFTEALVQLLSLRQLSALAMAANAALLSAPNVDGAVDDTAATVNLRRAIAKMGTKAKSKDELLAMITQLMG